MGEGLWEVCSHRSKQGSLSVLCRILPGQQGLVRLGQHRKDLVQQLNDVTAMTGQGPA